MIILQERHSAHFPEVGSEVQSSKETCLWSTVQEAGFKGGLVPKLKLNIFSPVSYFQLGVGVGWEGYRVQKQYLDHTCNCL